MNKKIVFLLCCVFSLIIVGFGFGASKLINRTTDLLVDRQPSSSDESSDTDEPDRTWFAAELPGATQLMFRDFNSADDLNKGGVFVKRSGVETLEIYDGMLDHVNTDNGYFEYRYSPPADGDTFYFFPSYDTKDLTALPSVSADVIVIDFDMWHPQGTPRTTFSPNYAGGGPFLFTNHYYTDFGESGGKGDPVNTYCINGEHNFSGEFIQAIYTLGNDFTRRLHITVMVFDTKVNYYVEGVLFYSHSRGYDSYNGLSSFFVSGFSDNVSPDLNTPESLDYGSFCMDNLEFVKFGDGNGSYTGVLMNFKTNDDLKISDILEVN